MAEIERISDPVFRLGRVGRRPAAANKKGTLQPPSLEGTLCPVPRTPDVLAYPHLDQAEAIWCAAILHYVLRCRELNSLMPLMPLIPLMTLMTLLGRPQSQGRQGRGRGGRSKLRNQAR